jgi:hypothetical protein
LPAEKEVDIDNGVFTIVKIDQQEDNLSLQAATAMVYDPIAEAITE